MSPDQRRSPGAPGGLAGWGAKRGGSSTWSCPKPGRGTGPGPLTIPGSTLNSVCSTTPKSGAGSSLGRETVRLRRPRGDSARRVSGRVGSGALWTWAQTLPYLAAGPGLALGPL